MKTLKNLAIVATLALAAGGCSYGAIAMDASGSKVVITKNDLFLFGALRQVYVCKVTEGGLMNCNKADRP